MTYDEARVAMLAGAMARPEGMSIYNYVVVEENGLREPVLYRRTVGHDMRHRFFPTKDQRDGQWSVVE